MKRHSDSCAWTTFFKNVISTYNVIEAATKLGRKIVIASSETTYGVCFAEGDKDFHSFPARGRLRFHPKNSYGLSKVCNEKTARAFAMRYGADIYAMRIGNVIEPHEYEPFTRFDANPPCASATPGATSTPATSARSCSVPQKDGLGYQVFNAVNDTITSTCRPVILGKALPRTRRSPARWASSKRRCRTARRANRSASRKRTELGGMRPSR